MTWIDPGTLPSSNYFQLVNSSTGIAPLNADVQDFFLGGTATGSARFQVEGLTGNATMSGTLTAGTIRPPTGPLTLQYKTGPNAWSNGLVINESGYVGIGTANPAARLDVNEGNLRFTVTDKPSTAPTASIGSAGSLSGTYYYRYTYVTANGETETSPYSSSVTVSSQQVDLTSISVGPTGTTARRIYRGDSVNTMRLVATINDNSTTSTSDNNGSPTTYAPFINTIGGRLFFNSTQTMASGTNNTYFGYNAGQLQLGMLLPFLELMPGPT